MLKMTSRLGLDLLAHVNHKSLFSSASISSNRARARARASLVPLLLALPTRSCSSPYHSSGNPARARLSFSSNCSSSFNLNQQPNGISASLWSDASLARAAETSTSTSISTETATATDKQINTSLDSPSSCPHPSSIRSLLSNPFLNLNLNTPQSLSSIFRSTLSSKSIGRIQPVKRPFPHRPSNNNYSYNSNQDQDPDPSFRHLPVIHFLLAINLIVFLAWQYAYERATKYRDPDLWIWMSRNFLSGQGNLRGGRWWTLISCCISQMDFMHFGVNMMSLYLTAPPILALLGPTSFLSLYFGAGITSSVVSMFWNQFIDPKIGLNPVPPGSKYSHGASGAVYAILTTFACIQPSTTFLLFFVVPVKAWLLVPGIFAYDIFNALKRPGGTTDSAGHVGGILFGLLFWRFRLRAVRML